MHYFSFFCLQFYSFIVKEIQVIREFDFFFPVSLECDINKKRKRKGKKFGDITNRRKDPIFSLAHLKQNTYPWVQAEFLHSTAFYSFIRFTYGVRFSHICWKSAGEIQLRFQLKRKIRRNSPTMGLDSGLYGSPSHACQITPGNGQWDVPLERGGLHT